MADVDARVSSVSFQYRFSSLDLSVWLSSIYKSSQFWIMSANPRPLRLPPMPKVADLLRVYGLSAKKQLSQNFILDLNITGNANGVNVY